MTSADNTTKLLGAIFDAICGVFLGSRKNLIFAANHCATEDYGLDGQPY